jgi:uncharacterized protein
MENAKNWFWGLLNGVLVVGMLLGLVGLQALYKYQRSLYPARTINVSAVGEANVSPDVATLSFSVVSEGEDPEEIATENNEKINEAVEFVKSEGIEAQDIRTTGYNLSPRYEYDEKLRRSFITGYTLTQTVQVKVRDFEKVGTILGRLPELGINQIGSLQFDIDDPEVYLNRARKEAFDKARVKAELMAGQNGVKLGRVVNFSEYQSGPPGPIPYYAEAFGRGGDVAAVSAPKIEPGSQEVTVSVSVTYEIK